MKREGIKIRIDSDMKNKESFEEFCNRVNCMKTNDCKHDIASLIYYQSIYVNENKLNPRRAIVRIKKILDAFEKKGRDEQK